MIKEGQLVEFTIVINTQNSSAPTFPLHDFVQLLNDIVTLHDGLFELAHPNSEYIPVLRVSQMGMQSPGWLKFISLKDIADGIARLLGIRKELEQKALENEKLRKQIESWGQQMRSQEQMAHRNQREAIRRELLIDQEVRQAMIETLVKAHNGINQVLHELGHLHTNHPMEGRQLEPFTYRIVETIGSMMDNEIKAEVSDIRIVEGKLMEPMENAKQLPSPVQDDKNV